MSKPIKIKHVTWRDGRPRFAPARTLRAMGYRAMDLKRDDGSWCDLTEAKEWSRKLCAELAKIRGKEPPPSPELDHPGVGRIYFVVMRDRVKIGFSRNPALRISQMMTSWAEVPQMTFSFPGTMGREKQLHRRLESHKSQGEWFKLTPTVLDVMQYCLDEARAEMLKENA